MSSSDTKKAPYGRMTFADAVKMAKQGRAIAMGHWLRVKNECVIYDQDDKTLLKHYDGELTAFNATDDDRESFWILVPTIKIIFNKN